MKLRNVEYDTMTAEGIVGYVGSEGVALLIAVCSLVIMVGVVLCIAIMTGVLFFVGFVMGLLHISGVDIKTWLAAMEYGNK